MENQNEKIVQELNELIASSKSGKEAYDTAAQNAKNPTIKSLFTNLGKQHEQVATELENQVRTLGGNTTGRSAEGRYQTNTWTTAKTVATRGNEKEVLEKFELGESEIEKKYDQVLSEAGLPAKVKEVVSKHLETQRNVHNQIRAAKSSVK